jgi:hypothetical protein
MEIREEDRRLFMKYAAPCAGTLVCRGNISQNEVDELIDIVKNGGFLPVGVENIFKVAFSACSLIAIDSGKREIDRDVIHQYYLFSHDKMIDVRYEEMGDFDPEACRIRPGVVVATGNGFAIVENSRGTGTYRTDYCSVGKGDTVVTHWDFVVEKINRAVAEEMKRQKIVLRVV